MRRQKLQWVDKRDYQQKAISFRWGTCDNVAYPLFGIYEELGELIEKTPLRFEPGFSGFKAKIYLWLLGIIGKRVGRIAKQIRGHMNKETGNVTDFTNPPFCLHGYTDMDRFECCKELGDIHWMLVNLDDQFLLDTKTVELANIKKLTERKNRKLIADHTDH